MYQDIPIYLITRYLSAEATVEERQQLEIWLHQSPANQKIFNEHEALWKNVRAQQNRFHVHEGLKKISARIDAYEEQNHTVVASRSWFTVYRVAASLAAIVIVTTVLLWLSQATVSPANMAWQQLNTTAGQQQHLVLTDSSIVQLNGQSELRYPVSFNKDAREVHLKGEAYFKIKPDKQIPFIIHTNDLTTHVVGTAFNIRSDSNTVVVSVTEGIVKMAINDDAVMLYAGDEGVYGKGSGKLIKEKANLEKTLAWMSKSMLLQDEPLSVVADKLYQLYGISSEFQNNKIKTCRITGKFKNMSVADILNAIEFSTNTSIIKQNNHLIWTGAGCASQHSKN